MRDWIASEANDYDSLADIGFSRFLQNWQLSKTTNS